MSLVTNVMFAGVGGQGLILMTRIVSQAAMLDGYDIKSNDVVGLSQRGGMVWGNVRIGEKVFSPNIPPYCFSFFDSRKAIGESPLNILGSCLVVWSKKGELSYFNI